MTMEQPGPQSAKKVDLIELVNNLQDKLAASGTSLIISLPQIVVVGSQSSGKSSTLENFVGKEFLPRGKGTVTRRPTIIQLTPSETEYAVFAHKPDLVYTDFEKVKEEIQLETLRLPGPKGFSKTPITLKIYSPNVLKLTLVDLPGLIKNVTEDQPQSAIDEVRNMVRSFIEQEESIILAVSPANNDLANSDALNIAREVDPMRLRTFGVLTKLDIMDEGTDALDILDNRVIPLQKGYVGVVNRSQKEIDDKRDINYVMEKERNFFANHPCYSHIAHRMGTKYLQNLLHKHLKAHIQASLPKVRNELSVKLKTLKKELKELNKILGKGSNEKRVFMLNLVQNFIDEMEMNLLGKSETVSSDKISAGALINNRLYTYVQELLSLKLEPNEEEMTIIIVNMSGIRTSISIPDLSLEAVNRRLVEQFKVPLDKAVDYVMQILLSGISSSVKVLDRYRTLKNEMESRLRECVEEASEKTKDRLNELIDLQMYYINMGHSDFDSSLCDPLAPTAGPVKLWNNTNDESSAVVAADINFGTETTALLSKLKDNTEIKKKVDYITTFLMKYLEIVRKQVKDLAIKYIVFFLVRRVLVFLKKGLIPCFVGSDNIDILLQDCDDEYRRQEELEGICSSLREGLEAIRIF